MKRTFRYASTGLLGLLVVLGVLLPWLEDAARAGLLAAAASAWIVQAVAFGLLVRYRERGNGFLAAWAGGTVARMALVLAAGLAVVELPALAPAPTLLGLAGFLLGLLLLEPFFLGAEGSPERGPPRGAERVRVAGGMGPAGTATGTTNMA